MGLKIIKIKVNQNGKIKKSKLVIILRMIDLLYRLNLQLCFSTENKTS